MRKDDRDDRRRDIERLVDVRRRQIFLQEKLHSIGRGLQQPKRADALGPHRFCMWPTTLRSSQTRVCHRRQQKNGDHDADLDERNEMKAVMLKSLT